MLKYENSCVKCETCTGCGANREYPVIVCDCCGEELDPDDAFNDGDEDLCLDCLKEKYSLKGKFT